jgi:predicted nucleotidyltransferase
MLRNLPDDKAESEAYERFGLKPSTVSAIQWVFAKHPQVELAVLYGSRAKGNYRPLFRH